MMKSTIGEYLMQQTRTNIFNLPLKNIHDMQLLVI